MGLYPGPRLLDFTKTPPHLQFNKYVLTGYRPASTAPECLRSLFYMHNELGNIYTHGIPFLLFMVLLPYSIPWMEVDSTWICVAHYLACLCPTIGSVLYHLFMNHVGGQHVYNTLLSLDMLGVCLVNTLDGRELPYSPQTLSFGGGAKSGKYADKQQAHQSQPLESAAGGTTGRMYDLRTAETEPAQKPYVKGEASPSAFAVQENAGYIKGLGKPDAPSPTPEYRPDLVGSFGPDEAVQDVSDADGAAGFLDSAAGAETRGEAHASEHPDDLQPPRQIQIQQHLKLHFQPQGGKKYDLNGFFGNGDDQD